MRELPSTEWLREFRRKLHEKAKAEPKSRFYSLYDKTYRTEMLEEAYRKAKANGGACGVDGETFEDVKKKGINVYLAELQLEMKERRYVPKPVRRVYIPKPNGKQRPLGIPTIRDRIVQTAFLLVLEPIFEADFADSSYGFRPQKCAHDAVREIYKYLNWGCIEVYDVDLEKYFDTVDHSKLMKLVARRISDGQILHVIRQWLDCGYVEDGQHRQSKRGTPQGGVISPLLANIYLNPVDQAFERKGLGAIRNGSIHLIRYADDMIILAQRNLKEGIALLDHYVRRLDLRLNREKTRRLKLSIGESVDFLGFRFHNVRSRKTGTRLILVRPSPRSQERFRATVRKHIHHSIPLRVKEQVENLNRYLHGWMGYFRLGNGSATFRKLAHFVNKRVRHVIWRRRGRRGYGWGKLTSEYIYGQLGLFYDYHVARL
ncbi:MAG: group II intron reverse transcriptase/maturase [Ignavibacteriales bacterium CG07_land_8_20_14_0_80_59_12]|nr:MAG: group II intron reverse transcriptase/maturase [Ignavibacteriales bacterium CG07_land_8_20_14_0_80_59_12]